MYVTRPLSLYLRNPTALSEPPPEGPSSGFLVVQDEEAENTCCFGLCEDTWVYDLPFPQNKKLTISYTTRHHSKTRSYSDDVVLIPVLNKPLSSNQYYAIQPHGRHKGEAHANSRDEDMGTCLCFNYVRDVDPLPLDPHDIYQQFVIYPYEALCITSGSFYAKSLSPDGHPPTFLKREGWSVYSKVPKNFYLGEAPGIFDKSLRARLPSFDVGMLQKSSPTVLVGRWYCPFMFVKDGAIGEQVKKSMYYEMTLHQRWERIYACDNGEGERRGMDTKGVIVDVSVKDTAISVGGKGAKHGGVANGILWFVGDKGEGCGVGLSTGIVERMRWEEGRFGWVSGDADGQLKVKRVDEYSGSGSEWKRFGCYSLVEQFMLKRMDGSVVMTYDFYHPHQVQCWWESERTRI